VAHNTLFKTGRVVWCGAVGYASVLSDVARATSLSPDPPVWSRAPDEGYNNAPNMLSGV